MLRLSLLLAAALLALPASAQTCGRTILGAFVETSTGPYSAGDTFEATLQLAASAGEDMGLSTMVLDFNEDALSFPSSPTANVDYEWVRYTGLQTTVDGNQGVYGSSIITTSSSRLTAFINYQAAFPDQNARGQAIPTTLTDAVRIRFTVVDPTLGLTVTPRSQQFYNGAGGPSGMGPDGPPGCFDTGTFTGLEVGQQQVAGGAGWRMLAPPAAGLTPDALAAFNHLQGIPGYVDEAAPNLLAGFDGAAYVEPGAADAAFAPGTGLLWYLYDAADFPGGSPPPAFQPLPMTLHHAGVAAASLVPGGQIGADAVSVPLHADGTGWNLVGNPFATGLDVTELAPVGGAFNSAVVQVWDPGPAGTGTYVLSSDPSLGGTVAGWQGFFLENLDATALSVPAAARTTSSFVTRTAPDSSATRPAPEHTVAFTLAGTMADGTPTLDRALVLVLDPAASAGWDLGDATKLTPFAPQYAALAVGGTSRDGAPTFKAQESRPLGDDGFSLSLALDVVGGGAELTLRWDPAALPEGVPVALRDVRTGATVDLHATDAYAFAAAGTAAARAALDPAASLRAASERFVLAVGQALPVARGAEAEVEELALEAPAPNPFRDRAVVRYAVPTAGPVRIAVYDALGREVAVLTDGEAVAGHHEVALRGGRLAAGLYVIRLEAGEQSLLRRVTVIR